MLVCLEVVGENLGSCSFWGRGGQITYLGKRFAWQWLGSRRNLCIHNEPDVLRCSTKYVILNFCKNHRNHLCRSIFFHKVVGWRHWFTTKILLQLKHFRNVIQIWSLRFRDTFTSNGLIQGSWFLKLTQPWLEATICRCSSK